MAADASVFELTLLAENCMMRDTYFQSNTPHRFSVLGAEPVG
jgi:hypothetical protein